MAVARARTLILALVAALALADASIVTLALPQLIVQLDTGVEGVAAVLAVYTGVLALALIPAWRLVRARGAGVVGVAGLALFALASLGCGRAGSLHVLLAARALQAVGGAAGLVAVFALVTAEEGAALGRRLWPLATVIGAAAGPALGGALTQIFDWRAIFLAQAPIALAGALACAGAPAIAAGDPAATQPRGAGTAARAPTRALLAPAVALGLLSAALTAVLFLLVLLLIAGWSLEPLTAALVVSVIPVAALAGSRVSGDARARAAGGSLLVGGGVIAFAFIPETGAGWTVVPQLIAGLGMGLALPALAGELLPERGPGDAARLLTVRHAGIALALASLAPIAAQDLDRSTESARLRGIAVLLDADLPAGSKLGLAPTLLAAVQSDDPRGGLRTVLAAQRKNFRGEQRFAYDRLAERADEIVTGAVADAFRTPFLLTGLLALLAGLLLLPRAAHRLALAGAAMTAAAVPLAYAAIRSEIAPDQVKLADPCKPRDLPDAPGLQGLVQKGALTLLDRSACRIGSSREELVLALADVDEAARYRKRYGVDPSPVGGLLLKALTR